MVCLPGFARTAADFHELALALSQDEAKPRRVLALDYRGRGLSGYDKDWKNYDIRVELDDLMQVLVATGIERAVFVGTSRGGLLTMALAAARPAAIMGVVLNDVGPVIDARGLLRIRGYVGKLPAPRSYGEGAEILKRLSDQQFPLLRRRRMGDDGAPDLDRSRRPLQARLRPQADEGAGGARSRSAAAGAVGLFRRAQRMCRCSPSAARTPTCWPRRR